MASESSKLSLKQLKYKKANIKGQVTSFLNFLNECENQEIVDNNLIASRLRKIEPYFNHFDEIQTEIDFIESVDNEEIIINDEERDLFQNSFFNAVAKANRLLEKYQNLNHPNIPASERSSINTNIKLPELSLPTFNGNFTQWNEFIDNFNAVIHNNTNISDAQKLCYLKRTLRGEAADLIAPFIQTNANYSIALELLKSRYDSKRKIIYSHVQALLEIPIITKENHSALNILINTAERHLLSLKSLDIPVENWDALLIPILTAKLDQNTARAWQFKIHTDLNSSEIPTYKYFIEFLKTQHGTLDGLKSQNLVQRNMHLNDAGNHISKNSVKSLSKTFTTTNTITCQFCNLSGHVIYNCERFKTLTPIQRNEKTKDLRLCYNCLSKGHSTFYCKSSFSCKTCRRRHHTLLHLNRSPPAETTRQETVPLQEGTGKNAPAQVVNDQATALTCNNILLSNQILLSTAIVNVFDIFGNQHKARVLLDSGSQSNFISVDLCKKLSLPIKNTTIAVFGIGGNCANVNSETELKLESIHYNFERSLKCLVIPKISDDIPNISFKANYVNIPTNIKLADSNFNISNKIDILLGAQIFWDLLMIGRIQSTAGIILQKTVLGWIVTGNLQLPSENLIASSITHLSYSLLHDQIAKFWEENEFPNQINHLTIQEKFCEQHFKENTTRDNSGKFIVKIPFKINHSQLGNSYDVTLKRFYALECKLNKTLDLKRQYFDFMREYAQLGHMSQVTHISQSGYFLPHHAVIKEDSTTTKLRVVFDGSLKTDTNLSLNDVQCVGPTIQTDLFSLILRFRTHQFVLTADIAQMYRQILVHKNDRKYQQILWRECSTDNIKIYELNTVTYGTASAPYLATRCLYELGVLNELKFPRESEIIKNDFYVDDLLTGANTISELKTLRDNIQTILLQGGFNLRKWNSNCKSLIPNQDNAATVLLSEEVTKTLGIEWNTQTDQFSYKVRKVKNHSGTTKRTILSISSQLFDPLGLLAPFLINTKLLIQKLWQLNLSWDETVPINIYNKWLDFKKQLTEEINVNIPRYILHKNAKLVELHGFSDASEIAYGACIYARVITINNQSFSNLLAAKSRVAPIKKTTLPRLELCAALLLAQLMNKLTQSIKISIHSKYYWCDSTITLCWLKASPSRWNTYVANRVSEIQRLTDINNWNHVKSTENPADIITRGSSLKELINSKIWWTGPIWLNQSVQLPLFDHIQNLEQLPECKSSSVNIATSQLNIFRRYSNLTKLINVTSYCYRFGTRIRQKGPLTAVEKNNTLKKLIRLAQIECFKNEINCLQKGKMLPRNSKLIQLKPFLDNDNILRVGGRISQSALEYNSQHQMLLPRNHPLTNLIATDIHKRMFHCGAQTLLFHLRERYWPIAGMHLTKHIIFKCLKCYRIKPRPLSVVMGNLPKERVTQSFPFEFCGVDYAGPISIKERRGRNSKILKSYICLFICFSTRAMHLEIVSNLSTECFISALRRFVARRGKPSTIFSDNGSNFVGANKELKKLYQLSQEADFCEHISQEGITWKFIPPRSPHFGGLWEAGIKSVKTALKKILGSTNLTFEDMNTVLTQIEASLNSRPLSPLSNDPNDLNPLTPAHFLIGRKYNTVADPSLQYIRTNKLSNYQFLQRLNQNFWKRWHREYLHQLQTHSKWLSSDEAAIKIGELVLLIEENVPPAYWRLGRVKELHTGKDNKVRVVTIRTSNGITKRAVTKLSRLPIYDDKCL